MKTIKVKNKTEGSKVAFKILQEEIEAGAKTLGLRHENGVLHSCIKK